MSRVITCLRRRRGLPFCTDGIRSSRADPRPHHRLLPIYLPSPLYTPPAGRRSWWAAMRSAAATMSPARPPDARFIWTSLSNVTDDLPFCLMNSVSDADFKFLSELAGIAPHRTRADIRCCAVSVDCDSNFGVAFSSFDHHNDHSERENNFSDRSGIANRTSWLGPCPSIGITRRSGPRAGLGFR